jgi:RecA/RadA recombinase
MTSASALRAHALRTEIEAALADRIPSALTPIARGLKPVAATGIAHVDALLDGGLPLGAITEMVGPECSGRTSLAQSFLAGMTQGGKVCAWIDVCDAFDPESAAANGVELEWLLWVRCGVMPVAHDRHKDQNQFTVPGKYLIPKPGIQGLHGGGCGPHPRHEMKGLSDAVGGFLRPCAPGSAEVRTATPPEREPLADVPKAGVLRHAPQSTLQSMPQFPFRRERQCSHLPGVSSRLYTGRPWARMEQALRVTDLLLQAGGFSAIVLDMGSIAPTDALRVPLATWFRYRAAAERSQASLVLLTQHACAKSSAGLLLRFESGHAREAEPTLFTGMEHRLTISRERFQASSPTHGKVIPLRKPPQSERSTSWPSRANWAGSR